MNFPMDINFGLAGEGLWREGAHEAERQQQESAGRKVMGVDKNSSSFQIPPVASLLCYKLQFIESQVSFGKLHSAPPIMFQQARNHILGGFLGGLRRWKSVQRVLVTSAPWLCLAQAERTRKVLLPFLLPNT